MGDRQACTRQPVEGDHVATPQLRGAKGAHQDVGVARDLVPLGGCAHAHEVRPELLREQPAADVAQQHDPQPLRAGKRNHGFGGLLPLGQVKRGDLHLEERDAPHRGAVEQEPLALDLLAVGNGESFQLHCRRTARCEQ